ncbi:MAG: 1,6-anhydro-N-acetylmuramyl-L-alanine amidase AmpD [Burkholderiaceae bacterium]|nr:1,6-anhydro-N-acetylmuramyl-L-alanine amidase AmpD [Burkholderiaceae bacterium]
MTAIGPVDEAGWVRGVARCASPYCDERPAGVAIELLVVHSISLPPGVFGSGDVVRLFTGRLDCQAHPFYAHLAGLRVSAHFLIERNGAVTQFVACGRRAWHAGASHFEGRAACNDFSIGVELEGCDFVPFTEAQYAALGRLLAVLRAAYPLRAVRGHSDIAPGRKTDPGPLFDWRRLHGHCPPALLPDPR